MINRCSLADGEADGIPSRSKDPIFKLSGPKYHSGYGFLGPETSNIGYLDPLGLWQTRGSVAPNLGTSRRTLFEQAEQAETERA